jgi:hypothetical protein
MSTREKRALKSFGCSVGFILGLVASTPEKRVLRSEILMEREASAPVFFF